VSSFLKQIASLTEQVRKTEEAEKVTLRREDVRDILYRVSVLTYEVLIEYMGDDLAAEVVQKIEDKGIRELQK